MTIWKTLLLAGTMLATSSSAWAGQVPGALSAPDVPISPHDRVYAAEQFSNTLSVTDPVDNKLTDRKQESARREPPQADRRGGPRRSGSVRSPHLSAPDLICRKCLIPRQG
jgi:hypothetical protein